MFFLFYISDAYWAWHRFLQSVNCEFPHPNKIDCFTYVTETEELNDWVYLYDRIKQTYVYLALGSHGKGP